MEHIPVTPDEATATLARAALDVLPLGVVIRDADGAELLRNRAAAALTDDYQAEALLHSLVDEVFRSAENGDWSPRTLELHGPEAWTVSVSAQDLPVGGRAVLLEDVTERQRLDRVKRDFVANVSHELRTPVGAIVLLTETLQGETDPEAAALLQAHIAEESKRAKRLVDGLLILSRVEAKGPVREQAVDVADVVERAAGLVAPLAADAGVATELELRDRPVVAGDAESLVSAVANLVENAVKYSERGSAVQVTLRSDDGTCELSVRDTGIGIPARDLDRIFERFYRVDRARSRGTGGAGLGLAIVRHVVESHGGSVAVESREGEGSVFELHLPEAPGASGTSGPVAAP